MSIKWLFFLSSFCAAREPCIGKDFGNGGTVCICNSTYCDTIPQPPRIPTSHFLVYTSNMAGLRFEQSSGKFSQLDNPDVNVELDPQTHFQTVLGFGGAFTDATGININKLSLSTQDALLKSYFGDESIGYTIGRVPIAGTDFSTRAYSYNDGAPDPGLITFKLASEDYKFKIPFIKKALKLTKNLRLFGSAWAAPKWMKTNNNYSGLGFIRPRFLQSWANYHVKFLEAYAKHGLQFWALTTGNEPADVLLPGETLEVVGWPANYLARWIRHHLGPTIKAYFPKLRLIIFDDQRAFLPQYLVQALQNPKTRRFIDGIAVHWYLDEYSPVSLLNETRQIFPEKFLISTEACNGFKPKDVKVLLGSWHRGEKYSFDIIQDMQNFLVGWTDWNMVLDLQGGPNYLGNFVDAPIIANTSSGEFYRQPMFYHLGHFSKFITQGSVRIQTRKIKSNCDVIAFRRLDRGTVVIFLNRFNSSENVNVKDPERGIAQLKITKKSITTLLYW